MLGHVAHRLDRYQAGRRLAPTVTREEIAAAIAAEIGACARSLPVATDGAERAAPLLADLL